jgi:hypothetical protein
VKAINAVLAQKRRIGFDILETGAHPFEKASVVGSER